jgi:molecular chaperone HtpG
LPKDEAAEEKLKGETEQFKPLIEKLKPHVPEVGEIRLSARLKESAACLVAADGGISAHMERLLGRMGRGADIPEAKRVLELNPDHAVVQAMQKISAGGGDDTQLATYARVLYDLAVLAEGSRIADPAAFTKRVNDLLVGRAS